MEYPPSKCLKKEPQIKCILLGVVPKTERFELYVN